MTDHPTTAILAITQEMRERKVNHGRHESPTLVAWAARIEAEITKIDALALAALAIADPRLGDRYGYRAAHNALDNEKREALRLALLPFLPAEPTEEIPPHEQLR